MLTTPGMLISIQGLLLEGSDTFFTQSWSSGRGGTQRSPAAFPRPKEGWLSFIHADRHLLPLHQALTFSWWLYKLVHCLAALCLQVQPKSSCLQPKPCASCLSKQIFALLSPPRFAHLRSLAINRQNVQ